jgi:acetyl-CoA carboxylase biotin carboxylase subunit/propionyl-CoA carboxylase alpha chain
VYRDAGGLFIMSRRIRKVLIANRGVTAVRVMHTCRDRKIPTTAVYSTPDRLAHHVFMADSAVHIGEAPPAESYLNMEKMINAAIQSKSDAIHPGWGFLAENAEFARMVIDAGLIWIGPPPEVIGAVGDKIHAKRLAQKANVPTIPGIIDVTDIDQIKQWMKDEGISFPIMIKAVAGGGKGMVKVESKGGVAESVDIVNTSA